MKPGYRPTRRIDELEGHILSRTAQGDPSEMYSPREWDLIIRETGWLDHLAEAARTQETYWRGMRLHVEALRADSFSVCETCSERFTGRKDARYCSPACRQKAYRERSADAQ